MTATATRAGRRHRAIPGRSRPAVVAGAGPEIAVASARLPGKASLGSHMTRLCLLMRLPPSSPHSGDAVQGLRRNRICPETPLHVGPIAYEADADAPQI